jgi:hypothetical protein
MSCTRQAVISQARAWLGCNEADGSHKKIIDLYNTQRPLPRGYAVKYDDAWCATFVSAVAVSCGATDIIYPECGCGKMVALHKEHGTYVENDAYVPTVGDIIFYDWEDSGNGDDTALPDHVGFVEMVTGNTITAIEGNNRDGVRRRNIPVNGKYITGFATPKYNEEQAMQKSVTDIAAEVIFGKWGNGQERADRLTKAGYDYTQVQNAVNALCCRAYEKEPQKSNEQIAHEVIRGDWGNGADRVTRLTNAGYNYDEVQEIVNSLL